MHCQAIAVGVQCTSLTLLLQNLQATSDPVSMRPSLAYTLCMYMIYNTYALPFLSASNKHEGIACGPASSKQDMTS